MRLLHVTPSYIPAWRYGGTILSVHGLCKGLASLGHEVEVYTTNVNGPENSTVPLLEPVEMDGVRVWYFPSRFLRRIYRSPELKAALEREVGTFDLIHTHTAFLWTGWTAARVARRAGVPYVISPRGMLVRSLIRRKSPFLKSAWITFIERRSLEEAAAVHATSAIEAEEIRRLGFKLSQIVIAPNGVDWDEDPQTAALPDERLNHGIWALSLGRVNWKKGLDRLIRALPSVPDLRLAIAGNDEEGYLPRLQAIVRELSLEDRVLFLGPVHGKAKTALYRKAAFFALPSHSENFGNAVLEAMAEGCPVVVSPDVGLAETVRQSQSGLVVPAEPRLLAEAFTQLVADPGERARLGERARETARKQFSWREAARQTASAYEEILKSCRGSHA